MKINKSHFWYNTSQRNGIFYLALFIIVLQLVYFFVDFSAKDTTNLNSEEIIQFQKEIDSLKVVELENRKPKVYPFNPSFLTDYRAYKLGLSTAEIDRLLQYRAAGNYINSAEQFQNITHVNDSLLRKIKPYFKFPDWVINNQKNKRSESSRPTGKHLISLEGMVQKKDLNSATAKELIEVNGIGEKLSKRIVNYRNKLGGFIMKEQLYEVWNLDSTVADKVIEKFPILNKPVIEKINVNTATFKEVLSIVYIDYELTKKIFNYRDEVAEIQSLEELKKIDGFPLDKYNRIALYLDAN